ncbi:MAG TPA: hypothetical protein VHF25_05040, partial [Nitriliruptorales bacterium]|nr:hypothetical protein [Nitriliruptorales bacterium]
GHVPGGRGSLVGEAAVVVQTRDPGHHAVQALVGWDPGGFWRAELPRRAELRFPPAAHAVRLDVGVGVEQVVRELSAALPQADALLGPRPAGNRSGLLIKSADRGATLTVLRPLRAAWSRDGLDVRVDVDPVDVL